MLAYRSSRRVDVLLRHRPIAAETDGDRVTAVTLRNDETGEDIVISAPYIIDATELGDLLELADVEHVIGAESKAQTGELHAVDGDPQPLDQQAITWCFAMDYLPGEDHTIDKPTDYDFWKGYQADFWPGPQLGWKDVDPITLETRHRGVFHGPQDGRRVGTFWLYRRVNFEGYYPNSFMPSGITLVNWPQIDYWLGPLLGVTKKKKRAPAPVQTAQLLAALLDADRSAPSRRQRLRLPWSAPAPTSSAPATGCPSTSTCVIAAHSGRVHCPRRTCGHGTARTDGPARRFHHLRRHGGTGSYRIDLHPSTAPRTYVDISNYSLPDSAGIADPRARGQPAAGLQEPGRHPHHQRLLPPAPRGVEHRRSRGRAGSVLPRQEPVTAAGAQHRKPPARLPGYAGGYVGVHPRMARVRADYEEIGTGERD
ncbi:MAG: FAD-dependent oxidoreductase [Caldilineaceae bacterium]